MRAVQWMGKHHVEVTQAPDPEIVNPHDAIVRVTLTAICGSDLRRIQRRAGGVCAMAEPIPLVSVSVDTIVRPRHRSK